MKTNASSDAFFYAQTVPGGWQVSTVVILSSGSPFTVCSDQNTYALVGSSYPNGSGISPRPKHRSINNWYNPEAFKQPANGTFGNVRKNSLYGPGINEVNLSGARTFSLPWAGVKLQVRADATNAFNHTSFGVPNQTLSSSSGPGTVYTNITNIPWAGRRSANGEILATLGQMTEGGPHPCQTSTTLRGDPASRR